MIGTFGVTMVVNVPMNNALDAVDPTGDEGSVVLAHLPSAVDGVEPRAGAARHRRVGTAGRVAPVTRGAPPVTEAATLTGKPSVPR